MKSENIIIKLESRILDKVFLLIFRYIYKILLHVDLISSLKMDYLVRKRFVDQS